MIKVHTTRHLNYQNFEQYPQSLSLDLRLYLDARQEELFQYIRDFERDPVLSTEENEWLARSYPVLPFWPRSCPQTRTRSSFRAIR